MFRLGFSEIILFLVIFFLVDPTGFPKIFRRIGKFAGGLKKMRQDFRGLIDIKPGTEQRKSPSVSASDMDDGSSPSGNEELDFEKEVMSGLKLVAIKALQQDYDFTATESVIKLLFDPSPEVRKRASELLFLEPVFSFERRGDRRGRPSKGDCGENAIEDLFSGERIAGFSDIIARIPVKYFHGGAGYLAGYPGIESLDLNRIFSGEKRGFYEDFRRNRKAAAAIKYPPQITVSPSYKCNLNCPYCFVQETTQRFPEDMSIELFRKVLDTADPDRRLKKVSLFGGEPTCFDGLEDFIDEIESRDLQFYFSTNGLAEPGYFSGILSRPSIESVTFHIERDDFYSGEQLDCLLQNVGETVNRKVKTFLRYNMQEKEYREWGFLDKYFDLAPELDFSFSLLFPARSRANEYIRLEHLQDFKAEILSLVEYFVEKPFTQRCKPVFAKPYPLCFFNRDELYFILKNSRVKNICEIDRNGGTNNLIVHPDGSFSPCMAFIADDYSFSPISKLDELPTAYYSKIGDMKKVPLLEACRNCSLHERGLCQAACYAYL